MICFNKENLDSLKELKETFKKENTNYTLKEFFETFDSLKEKHLSDKPYTQVFKTYSIDFLLKHTLNELSQKKNQNILKRLLFNKKHKCLAPFTTLNFDSSGNINVCCYNRTYSLGKYPDVTLMQAWFGDKLKHLREQIQNYNFNVGCDLCCDQIISKNYENSLLRNFDMFKDAVSVYPINLEFEFGNVCNYECIMCGGKWSSSIRKNREKLSPIKTPFDDAFIKQVIELAPHLKSLKFLGGEPFLTPIYYKILEQISEINNDIVVFITTNGSILNERVLKLREKFKRIGVIVSLDSLNNETYSKIRKNGNLPSVLKNINTFYENKMLASIAFSPVIQNVYETHDVINFCQERNIKFFINTVNSALGGKIKGIHENGESNKIWDGESTTESVVDLDNKIPEFCLSNLSEEELDKVISFLESKKHFEEYQKRLDSFINHLKSLKKQ